MNQMKNGFIALTSVLIISAVTLSAAVSISLLGISEARNSLDFKKGIEAFKLAEACGEEGLLRSRNSTTYTGGSLAFQNGSCTIAVSDITEGSQIDVAATLTGPPMYTKNIRILAENDGNGVTIVTWEEIE